MSADGSGKQRLTKSKFYETNPVYSRDGTRIAFTGARNIRNLSKRHLGRGFELYTMAADGETGSGARTTAGRSHFRTGNRRPEQGQSQLHERDDRSLVTFR